MRVSWEIFGPAITIQLAGQVEENEYMAFGLSGSEDSSQMLGSDASIAYIDGYRGFATDYNITAMTAVNFVFINNAYIFLFDIIFSVLKSWGNIKVSVRIMLLEDKTAIKYILLLEKMELI